MSNTQKTQLIVVALAVLTIALSLTIHAPALAGIAAVFGLLAAGMHLRDLFGD